MKQQLRPNRNITMGDRGEKAIRTEFTKREKKEAFRASVDAVKIRMRDWTDDFVKKVYYENQNQAWHIAAKETLNERKVPRDANAPFPQGMLKPEFRAKPQGKVKKRKQKKHGTPEERAARSTNWKLDRQLDQKLRDTP